MFWLLLILLIAGGVLACSALIVAKKPDAKHMLEKLVPFQALIGLALLIVGVISLLQGISMVPAQLSSAPVMAIAFLGGTIGGALLGVVFAMPLISKTTGKDGSAVAAKLAPYQVILGLVCLGSAALMLLARFNILGNAPSSPPKTMASRSATLRVRGVSASKNASSHRLHTSTEKPVPNSPSASVCPLSSAWR